MDGLYFRPDDFFEELFLCDVLCPVLRDADFLLLAFFVLLFFAVLFLAVLFLLEVDFFADDFFELADFLLDAFFVAFFVAMVSKQPPTALEYNLLQPRCIPLMLNCQRRLPRNIASVTPLITAATAATLT